MEELDVVYVIKTSEGVYLVEDEIYEGKVVDEILELAVCFDSREEVEGFLQEMKNGDIEAKYVKLKFILKFCSEQCLALLSNGSEGICHLEQKLIHFSSFTNVSAILKNGSLGETRGRMMKN